MLFRSGRNLVSGQIPTQPWHGISDFKTADLDDRARRNRRKTDDGQAAQDFESHKGCSARSPTWTRSRQTVLPDESRSSSRRFGREVG